MKNKITWVMLAVSLVVLLGGASLLYSQLESQYQMEQLATQPPAPTQEEQPEETQSSTEPKLAPDFTAVDGEGNEVSLSNFVGKPIVLNFWASWCGPCKSEMPDFNEAFLDMGDEIQFLMVNMTDGGQETLDTAKNFVENSGYSFPVLYDVNYDAAITYSVTSLPTTYFIGSDGSLVAYARGAIDANTLQRGIDMITE